MLGLSVLALGPAGCTSMSQDVDAYYRQMAVNYKEAAEKARMDEIALENETKVLATTGDFANLKKSQAQAQPHQGLGGKVRQAVAAI